jgi:membrane protease YdiL (CAAX protease family)
MEIFKTINVELLICLAGVIIFSFWLLRTSFGARALDDCPARRNNMPFYMPVFMIFFWMSVLTLNAVLSHSISPDEKSLKTAFLTNIFAIPGGLITSVIIMIVVRPFFARGLKGFGLNLKTIPADLGASILNLLVVWPLVLMALVATTFVGQFIWGEQYQLKQHQELMLLDKYPQAYVRIIIAVVTIAVVPFIEELLFRGLFQTTIRSFLKVRQAAWAAIIACSLMFAFMHEEPAHWPALFILGVILGYSYEKSGSLFRPIFLHSFFNAASVAATWIQSSQTIK